MIASFLLPLKKKHRRRRRPCSFLLEELKGEVFFYKRSQVNESGNNLAWRPAKCIKESFLPKKKKKNSGSWRSVLYLKLIQKYIANDDSSLNKLLKIFSALWNIFIPINDFSGKKSFSHSPVRDTVGSFEIIVNREKKLERMSIFCYFSKNNFL